MRWEVQLRLQSLLRILVVPHTGEQTDFARQRVLATRSMRASGLRIPAEPHTSEQTDFACQRVWGGARRKRMAIHQRGSACANIAMKPGT